MGPSGLQSPAARPFRHWAWVAYVAAWVLAPIAFTSDAALTLLTQTGYFIIICLSFNLLLGQGGMLSFGHAVYSGLGAYAVIHALNAAGQGGPSVPVSLMPLLGGAVAALAALLLGWPSTRKSGTAFAMITLGVGELVFAASQMFTGVFGGESGISANRVVGPAVWGISFGPQREVYALVASYAVACTAALYAFTQTPLGRMLEAARDNALRVEFIGYSAHQLRFRAFVFASFFAGVGGGLSAINFENVTAESLGSMRSASILLFTVLGGTALFFGPVLGGLLWVSSLLLLSDITRAWQVYTGLAFVLVVMYAPGGLAGLLVKLRGLRRGAADSAPTAHRTLLRALALMPVVACVVLLVEVAYHRRLGASLSPVLNFGAWELDTASGTVWLALGLATAMASAAALLVWKRH
jgi:branched-chain amino acid transport system permease protein